MKLARKKVANHPFVAHALRGPVRTVEVRSTQLERIPIREAQGTSLKRTMEEAAIEPDEEHERRVKKGRM